MIQLIFFKDHTGYHVEKIWGRQQEWTQEPRWKPFVVSEMIVACSRLGVIVQTVICLEAGLCENMKEK